jgi:hypothetical protein
MKNEWSKKRKYVKENEKKLVNKDSVDWRDIHRV